MRRPLSSFDTPPRFEEQALNPACHASVLPARASWLDAPDEDFAETGLAPLEEALPTVPAPLGPPETDLDLVLDDDVQNTA
jgi:hypothetical protein